MSHNPLLRFSRVVVTQDHLGILSQFGGSGESMYERWLRLDEQINKRSLSEKQMRQLQGFHVCRDDLSSEELSSLVSSGLGARTRGGGFFLFLLSSLVLSPCIFPTLVSLPPLWAQGVDFAAEDCAVCQECFLADEVQQTDLKRLPCGHLFHDECIVPWLQGSVLCPLCRDDVAAALKKLSKAQKAAGISLRRPNRRREHFTTTTTTTTTMTTPTSSSCTAASATPSAAGTMSKMRPGGASVEEQEEVSLPGSIVLERNFHRERRSPVTHRRIFLEEEEEKDQEEGGDSEEGAVLGNSLWRRQARNFGSARPATSGSGTRPNTASSGLWLHNRTTATTRAVRPGTAIAAASSSSSASDSASVVGARYLQKRADPGLDDLSSGVERSVRGSCPNPSATLMRGSTSSPALLPRPSTSGLLDSWQGQGYQSTRAGGGTLQPSETATPRLVRRRTSVTHSLWNAGRVESTSATAAAAVAGAAVAAGDVLCQHSDCEPVTATRDSSPSQCPSRRQPVCCPLFPLSISFFCN